MERFEGKVQRVMGKQMISRRRVIGTGAAIAGGVALGAPSALFGSPVVRVAEHGRYQDVTEVTFHHIWGTPPGQADTREAWRDHLSFALVAEDVPGGVLRRLLDRPV